MIRVARSLTRLDLCLIALWALNLAGMLEWPETWILFAPGKFNVISMAGAGLQVGYYVAILTVVPLTLLCRHSTVVARYAGPALNAAFVFALIAVLVTSVLWLAFSNSAESWVMTLTSLNLIALCYLSSSLVRFGWEGRRILQRGALVLVLVLPVWSLSSAAMLQFQARSLADGRAYCIGTGWWGDTYPRVEGFWQTRGISLFSRGTGYDGRPLVFHAVLDVEGEAEVWNWSKRRMRFELIERPEVFRGQRLRCEDR